MRLVPSGLLPQILNSQYPSVFTTYNSLYRGLLRKEASEGCPETVWNSRANLGQTLKNSPPSSRRASFGATGSDSRSRDSPPASRLVRCSAVARLSPVCLRFFNFSQILFVAVSKLSPVCLQQEAAGGRGVETQEQKGGWGD
jgi:hypothetical protein